MKKILLPWWWLLSKGGYQGHSYLISLRKHNLLPNWCRYKHAGMCVDRRGGACCLLTLLLVGHTLCLPFWSTKSAPWPTADRYDSHGNSGVRTAGAYRISSVLVTYKPRVSIGNFRCQTMVLRTGDMHGCVASWAGTLHTCTMPPFAPSGDTLA